MTQVSVIVGSRLGEGDERRLLDSLGPQVRPEVEVLVVRDSDRRVATPPWATVLVRPASLTPELWSHGLHEASGAVVAFTAPTMIPSATWLDETLALHRDGHVAVGGPIEPGPGLRWGDWAVYFCRYAPYAAPVDRGGSPEIAADNGSYERAALERHADLLSEAFLEPFLHRALRAEGVAVEVLPDRPVQFAGGPRFVDFCRLRLAHGRHHGRRRSVDGRPAHLWIGVLSAPAVPLVMLFRAGRSVARKGRLRGRFVVASPLVLVAYCFWAAGELVGRLESSRRERAAIT